jgi:hypothetical protein
MGSSPVHGRHISLPRRPASQALTPSGSDCPSGTTENSPPFQRRVRIIKRIQVPPLVAPKLCEGGGRPQGNRESSSSSSSIVDFLPSLAINNQLSTINRFSLAIPPPQAQIFQRFSPVVRAGTIARGFNNQLKMGRQK